MKRTLILSTILATTFGVGAALASDDCRAPMQSWQPREAMEAQATGYGWTDLRVRTDDGCHKVDDRDAKGNKIEVEFHPDTLTIRELGGRVRHRQHPGRSGGLDPDARELRGDAS